VEDKLNQSFGEKAEAMTLENVTVLHLHEVEFYLRDVQEGF
jgi:hypothetical protein